MKQVERERQVAGNAIGVTGGVEVPPAEPDRGHDEPPSGQSAQELREHIERRFDEPAFERAWQLSWLKAFAQLAFCLVDPLVGSTDREEARRARATCRAAVARARQILDTQSD